MDCLQKFFSTLGVSDRYLKLRQQVTEQQSSNSKTQTQRRRHSRTSSPLPTKTCSAPNTSPSPNNGNNIHQRWMHHIAQQQSRHRTHLTRRSETHTNEHNPRRKTTHRGRGEAAWMRFYLQSSLSRQHSSSSRVTGTKMQITPGLRIQNNWTNRSRQLVWFAPK